MNSEEQLCSIALTLCPGIGHVGAKRLIDSMGSAAEVFRRRKELPEIISEASAGVVAALDCPAAFARAGQELEFVEKNRLTCLTLKDEAYPGRLRECDDAPVVLFFKGNVDFNRLHVINMVGTRRATDYGKQFCADFLHDLATLCPDVLVVSGLAYGIDIHAHRAALANGLSTVAVLAHGLDRLYPYVHRKTAVDMLTDGGLLTEFLTGTNPDRYNFVSRNRIVAGMCDATIVVESAAKGGSLITADLAEGYHRDCFAVPGRITDTASTGCNRLIRDSKAALIQTAEEFVQAMSWSTTTHEAVRAEGIQRNLFPELSEEEERVVHILARKGDLHINALVVESNIPVNRMSALLFELEMKGVAKAMPGDVYHLLARS
ncbi:DNA-processing protein DprA [Bacteroides zoogleoformans]|uniref:DNA-protecting protein DprA n=1 Tax=Bacteroides zoogleoformans TaxID=28119 RepID=A0ABM6T7W7_9BACE|nr:DNA-processing protein DprA [Bacteroides zoogleoformans]AVM52911.1 DNA-protecting protein DprA [Bacteroides zoogleoformans]